MGDLLKVIAAVVLVGAAIKYGARHMAEKALANAEQSLGEFELKALEIPETNFQFNPNWAVDAGIVWPEGGMGKAKSPAGEVSETARTNDATTGQHSALREEVRQMHEAIRSGADPKREMERMRDQMRRR